MSQCQYCQAAAIREGNAIARAEAAERELAVARSAGEGRETMLLELIRIVRCHPDFDAGGSMADAMDQALRGETPKLVQDLASLAQGRKPAVAQSAREGRSEERRCDDNHECVDRDQCEEAGECLWAMGVLHRSDRKGPV